MTLSSHKPSDMNPDFLRPWIIGHRGASDVAPENTRSSIAAALTSGCDGIETDIQMTRDRIPVLYHDRTLYKINGSLKRVSEVDFEQLQKFDWGGWFSVAFNHENLFPLAELLRDYAPRTRLFLEIKSRNVDRRSGHHLQLTEILVEMVRTRVPRRFYPHLFLLSFDREVLALANRLESEWSYVWNVDKEDTRAHPEFVKAICVPVKNLTPQLVQEFHRMDKRVMTYTCNTPQQADYALSTGADVLMTDRPAWLVGYLKKGQEPE